MKSPLIALAGALLVTGVPAASQDIVVSAENAAVDSISRDLSRNLVRADWPRPQPTGEGITMVRFQRGADGRPTDVTIYRRSGQRSVDRRALEAVTRLGRGTPLPAIGTPNQIFQANIILANSHEAFADLSSQLVKLEQARLADPRERTVFAFGSAPRTAS
jgi:TonB family protein